MFIFDKLFNFIHLTLSDFWSFPLYKLDLQLEGVFQLYVGIYHFINFNIETFLPALSAALL